MRGNLIVGMLAGAMIGAIAAMIAMPYVGPQVDRWMKRGKNIISNKLNEMGINQDQGNPS